MPCLTYFHQARCNPPQSKYFTERKIPWGSSRIFLQGEWNHVTVALCRQLVYSDPAQGREWLWNGYQLQEGRTRHAFGFVCIPQPKNEICLAQGSVPTLSPFLSPRSLQFPPPAPLNCSNIWILTNNSSTASTTSTATAVGAFFLTKSSMKYAGSRQEKNLG